MQWNYIWQISFYNQNSKYIRRWIYLLWEFRWITLYKRNTKINNDRVIDEILIIKKIKKCKQQ